MGPENPHSNKSDGHNGEVDILEHHPEPGGEGGPDGTFRRSRLCLLLLFFGQQTEFLQSPSCVLFQGLTCSFREYFRFDHLDKLGDTAPDEPAIANLATNSISQDAFSNHICYQCAKTCVLKVLCREQNSQSSLCQKLSVVLFIL